MPYAGCRPEAAPDYQAPEVDDQEYYKYAVGKLNRPHYCSIGGHINFRERFPMKSERQKVSLPRILLAVLALAAAAWFLRNYSGQAREYQLYFSDDRPAVHLRYEELSGDWTEQTLQARFPKRDIRCYTDSSHGMGDRACALDVFKNGGVPTLFISFFFDKGHLNAASFNIPWWAHNDALDNLVATYGQPYAEQDQAHSGVRLIGWKLPSGAALFYNRDRDINPLVWSSVFWNSAEHCARLHCF